MTVLAVSTAAYLVLAALIAGSFINLVADRLPRGESLVRPRSHCRSCGRQLNAVDLLPVAGYLVRRGKCATCGASIGVDSPAVEAACGISMACATLSLGVWPGVAVGVAAIIGIGAALTALKSKSLTAWRSEAKAIRP